MLNLMYFHLYLVNVIIMCKMKIFVCVSAYVYFFFLPFCHRDSINFFISFLCWMSAQCYSILVNKTQWKWDMSKLRFYWGVILCIWKWIRKNVEDVKSFLREIDAWNYFYVIFLYIPNLGNRCVTQEN